jgi:hypothetical protein
VVSLAFYQQIQIQQAKILGGFTSPPLLMLAVSLERTFVYKITTTAPQIVTRGVYTYVYLKFVLMSGGFTSRPLFMIAVSLERTFKWLLSFIVQF